MEKLTAKDFYREDKKWLFSDQKEIWCKEEIIGLMEDYHQAKLKLLRIADVGQSFRCIESDLTDGNEACPVQCNFCKRLKTDAA